MDDDDAASTDADLPDAVWLAITRVARDMLRDMAMSRAFETSDASGRLETELTIEEREGVSTIQFLGSIETAEGAYELAFDLVVELVATEDRPDADTPPITVWNTQRGGPPN